MYTDTKLEEEIAAIDLMGPEPSDEHSRELYYIGKLRTLIAERSKEAGRQLTACTVTFGCQMNARDSEKLIGSLVQSGFAPVETEEADFVIFNTCTVRDNADQRTFGRLGRISHLKKKNPYMKVAICGCMMQEKGNVDKVRKSYPFVDLIFGTHNIYRFAQQVKQGEADEALVKSAVTVFGEWSPLPIPVVPINRAISGTNALREGKTDSWLAPFLGYSKY